MALNDLHFPKHYVSDGIYVKELWLEHAGDTVRSHKHEFDHLSLLASGSVKITCDGVETIYTGRTAVVIEAGKEHKIVALTPNTLWYCLHNVPAALRGEAMLDAQVEMSN